jgi:hypothetical protein
MLYTQKTNGRNIGKISQKKNTVTTTAKGIPKNKNNKPRVILPAYNCPAPGIMKLKSAPMPRLLVP